MRPKQRIRKIYTESDLPQQSSLIEDTLTKTNNINIRDLELNLSDPNKSTCQQKSNTKNYIFKNSHFYIPNKFNKMNRKELIKKLPDINLTSLNTISKPLKLAPLQTKQQDRSASNKKNTFLLNSLFQILKPQHTTNNTQLTRLKERTLKFASGNKNMSIDYENEFINLNSVTTQSSTKNRGPKVLQNEITRLSGHNNSMRRKIVSQEKSRPKFMDKSLQKLKQTTFQHFRRSINKRQQQNSFNMLDNQQPKQNFENLEIITFYNKFPNFTNNSLKRKQEEKHIPFTTKEIRIDRESKQPWPLVRTKTDQPYYHHEEENEFIFDKK